MDRPVTLRARVVELTARKAVLTCAVFSGEVETARGEVAAVLLQPPPQA